MARDIPEYFNRLLGPSAIAPGKKAAIFEAVYTPGGRLVLTSPVSLNYLPRNVSESNLGFVNDIGYNGRGQIRNPADQTEYCAIFENGEKVRTGSYEEIADAESLRLAEKTQDQIDSFLPSLVIAAAIVGKGLGLAGDSIAAIMSSSGSGSGGSSTADAALSPPVYEDCYVTYDALKHTRVTSGEGNITFRSTSGDWTATYQIDHPGSGYLIPREQNLEGKLISVRFEGGEPVSLQSRFGNGSCKIRSASRK